MKAYIILFNWILSFMGLSVNTETTPMWIVLILPAWFAGSSLLLTCTCRKGWMDKVVKRFKMDEL